MDCSLLIGGFQKEFLPYLSPLLTASYFLVWVIFCQFSSPQQRNLARFFTISALIFEMIYFVLLFFRLEQYFLLFFSFYLYSPSSFSSLPTIIVLAIHQPYSYWLFTTTNLTKSHTTVHYLHVPYHRFSFLLCFIIYVFLAVFFIIKFDFVDILTLIWFWYQQDRIFSRYR